MNTATFPYVTRLNTHFAPLEIVDEKSVADACKDRWFNQTLCQVNESVVRLGVDRAIELGPRQGVVIPRGVMHRPRAGERTVMLMVETKSIIPTGCQ